MAIINTVTLTGRLTKNAEMKMTQGGYPIINFSIAVSERVHDTTQENGWGERPNYFEVVGFGNYYKVILPALTKGREITVCGKLHQDRWQKDGANYSRVCIYAEECVVQREPSKTPMEVRDTQAKQFQAQAEMQVPQAEAGVGEMIF